MRLPTLELANINVMPGYSNQGRARYVIEALAHIASYYQHYFVIENVQSPALRSSFHKHRTLYALDMRSLPGCFWRVFEQPERTFDIERAVDERLLGEDDAW